jgi:hypothetical protein
MVAMQGLAAAARRRRYTPQHLRARSHQGNSSKTLTRSLVALAAVTLLTLLPIGPASAAGQSFTSLQPGFTQELFGVNPNFFGGVAFAPDGDPLVDNCSGGGSPLFRFDRQTNLPPVNGTSTLHPNSTLASGAGCGLTNHPNGSLYTNTTSGVVRLNANTGAQTGGPFGVAGNALGIAPDPQTGNLVYVGSDGTIRFVNAALTTSGTFSTVTSGNFVDGIFFSPDGNFLFLANRSPIFRVTIVNRSGGLVQHVLTSSEPDGIAFHAIAPKFVVTNNTNGTLTRLDFPGDNFSQPPSSSTFASGGFRGDLSQVGPDGCLYVTQDNGTRYDNGTVDSNSSLVRICGGFAPPPGVDDTPPSCTIVRSGTTTNVTFRDTGGGLNAINVLGTRNATASVPPFSPGTTAPVTVVVNRVNAAQPGSARLRASDVAGNIKYCTLSGWVAT